MDTEGTLAPDTAEAAREQFRDLESAATTVTREVARQLLEPGAYDERVTDDVVATAHEALFAAQLRVHVGTRDEFEDWYSDRDLEVVELGSDQVDGVAWHPVPFAGVVVAATFSAEPDAAVETLRRQAVGRYYREVV